MRFYYSYQKFFFIALLAITATLFGYFFANIAEILSAKPILLLAPPLVIVLLYLSFAYRDQLVLALFVLRASLDPILDLTKFNGGIGLGGLLNLFILFLGLLYCLDKKYKKPPLAALWPLPLFFLLAIASSGWSIQPLATIRQSLNILTFFASLWIGYAIFSSSFKRNTLLVVFLASSIVPFLVALLQLVRGEPRISGTFSHPNIFAFYVLTMIGFVFLAWVGYWLENTKKNRLLLMSWSGLALLLLIATATRSAWVGLIIVFIIYSLIANRKMLLPIVLMPIFSLLLPPVQDRVADLFQGNERIEYAQLNSFAWRKELWISSLDYVQRQPWFGYGYSTFGEYANQFFYLANFENIHIDAHNSYVQVLFDLGLVGLLVYFFVFFFVYRWAYCAMKFSIKPLAVFSGFFVAYLVVSFSDNTLFYLSYNWYFWMLIGSLVAIFQKNQELEVSYNAAK